MQIYYTDNNPARCAANLPDALTNKILLEVAQILCTVCHKHRIDAPYKPTHENHPFVKWAEKSITHWRWLRAYGLRIALYWARAYNKKGCWGNPSIITESAPRNDEQWEFHKSEIVIGELEYPSLPDNPFIAPPKIFAQGSFENWPTKDIIQLGRDKTHIAYQKYLNWKVNKWRKEGKNKRLYTWTNRPQPEFITLEN